MFGTGLSSQGENKEDAKQNLLETAIESNLPLIRPVLQNDNPLNTRPNDILDVFKIVIVISPLLVSIVNRKRLKIVDFVVMVYAVVMPFVYLRLYPFFVIINLLYFSDIYIDTFDFMVSKSGLSINKDKKDFLIRVLSTTGIALSIFLSIGYFLYQVYSYPTMDEISKGYYPTEILEYIEDNNIDIDNDVMLNAYNTGGYLIFNNKKVFIDGRCDPYLQEFSPDINIFRELMGISSGTNIEIKEFLEKYNVKYILEYKNSRVVLYAETTGEWESLIEEEDFILLRRSDSNGYK